MCIRPLSLILYDKEFRSLNASKVMYWMDGWLQVQTLGQGTIISIIVSVILLKSRKDQIPCWSTFILYYSAKPAPLTYPPPILTLDLYIRQQEITCEVPLKPRVAQDRCLILVYSIQHGSREGHFLNFFIQNPFQCNPCRASFKMKNKSQVTRSYF